MKKSNGKKIKTSFSRKLFNVFNLLVLTLLMVSCFLPFVYVVAVSFSDKVYVQAGQVNFLPKGFNTLSYQYLINKIAFWRAFGISILRTVLGTLVNLLLIILTAYPLSKSDTKLTGRSFYTWFFFITMLVSGGMIPNFVLVGQLGLRDNILSLILPGALPVFNLVLMINFFRQVPIEMEEAAMIDGASHVKILAQIYVPLSKAAMATISLFCMVNHWNAWFDGMIYMKSPEKLPLQTYLRNVILKMDMSQMTGDDYGLLQMLSNDSIKCTQIVVAVIPILCVYPFLQKYFVKGIVLGGVKG
ncbi:MAG: carbohydrate ABC transporter permease [Dorea sp.]|jgi:putative aldouronate transport system permease protein|nr:carbohydrate ABC transporter permease [Dorea sp.]